MHSWVEHENSFIMFNRARYVKQMMFYVEILVSIFFP